MTLNPERRAAILEAVATWLDEHPDEPLPAGLDPALQDEPAAPPADLAELAGAVLACRHDVKLHTKVVKRLEEQLAAVLAGFEASRARQPRDADPADALTELYDRVRRCTQACSEAGSDLPWLSGRAAVQRRLAGIAAGIDLTLQRAGELLAAAGLRTIDPTGQPFDPATMRAAGTRAADDDIAAGHVAETLRVGLERDGEVVRPAEVLVARERTAR
ncbi:MAG: nucleotide exchange factor GrpE [Planctomycetes bacterium]|nr:nucleotide exchange factor GrpE [Planctomycetota bacterium]